MAPKSTQLDARSGAGKRQRFASGSDLKVFEWNF
jgi:hypothetical protein